MKRILAALIATPALVLAGLTAAPLTAQASNPVATPSWGAANLISYGDSDFEAGVADWVSAANSTLTQDTTAAFLHKNSLKATAVAAGTQQYKLGPAAGQINVTAGDTYRVSGWFDGTAGRTVTWALPFYTSSGTWIGWTSGTAATLATTGSWQYVSATITAPVTAGYAWGGPRVTETGAAVNETLNMDEVLAEPYRAATLIGAKDHGSNNSGGEFTADNSAVGPLQSDKIFYDPSTALPASYTGSACASLPANVTCIISYKVLNTNVASYVSSIPASRNVIFTFWQEPENPHTTWSYQGLTGGPAFVAEFENQVTLIRSSAAGAPNIFTAGDAETYQYAAGTAHNNGGGGGSCAFTPPAAYADFYLADNYENPASGSSMATDAASKAQWLGWLGCASAQNKPIGLAEYGLNCPGGNPNALSTSQGMAADNSYLESQPDGLPVVLWNYWYDDNAGACIFTTGGSPNGTAAVTQWQANETQNGGGAN